MKAIVTGCAGFIGSHLAEDLLERGYKVMGVDNLRTGTKENMATFIGNERFEFLEKDVAESQLRENIEQEYDVLFHLAAVSSVKYSCEHPLEVHRINTTGTIQMLELARLSNIPKIVFVSSAAIYGDPESLPVKEEDPIYPMSPYAASKASAENYVMAYQESYNIQSTILRYFNVYGPRQAYSEYSGVISIFLNQAIEARTLTIEGDGKQTRSFIYVDDVVDLTRKSAESESCNGQTINVSGTERVSISDLAEIIDELVQDKDLEISHVPKRPGDVRDSIGDMSKTQKLLNFMPRKSLREGLSETLAWYRAHT